MKKILNYLETIHRFFSLFILLLMASSFAVGIYIVFLSETGLKSMNEKIYSIPFFVLGSSFWVHIDINVWSLFLILWSIYLFLFLISLKGLRKDFKPLIQPFGSKFNATINPTVSGFSSLVVVTELIRNLQNFVGIETGSLPKTNPIVDLTKYSIAPLTEEFGFRMSIIGLASMLMLISIREKEGLLSALWKPVVRDKTTKKFLYMLIVVSSILFGLAHIFGGWKLGKFTEAFAVGFVAGLVYINYGFQAPVILHWSFNYFASTFYTLGSFINSNLPSEILNYSVYPFGCITLIRYGLMFYIKLWKKQLIPKS